MCQSISVGERCRNFPFNKSLIFTFSFREEKLRLIHFKCQRSRSINVIFKTKTKHLYWKSIHLPKKPHFIFSQWLVEMDICCSFSATRCLHILMFNAKVVGVDWDTRVA